MPQRLFAYCLLAALLCLPLLAPAQSALPDAPTRARLGANVEGVSHWSSMHLFANAMYEATAWRTAADEEWTEVDANGYPIALPDEGLRSTVINRYHQPGVYVLEYRGTADFRFSGEIGATLLASSPGRQIWYLRPDGAGILELVGMDPEDRLTSVKLWLPGAEGMLWNPALIAATSQFGVLRYMDLMRTNNSQVATWDDRPQVSQMSYHAGGVPIEHLIELANVSNSDPWFCVPHLADDDFVRRMAELVRERLKPGRTVYVEYSNEIHNGAFGQGRYATEQAIARGYADEETYRGIAASRFYGVRSAEVFEIWREVFGDDRDHIVGVVTDIIRRDERFGEVREIFAFQDSYQKIDAFATAPYSGVGLGRRFGKPVSEVTPDDVMNILVAYQLNEIRAELARARAMADEFGLPLLSYEGGQHVSVFGGGIDREDRPAFAPLVEPINQHPRMEELYRIHLADWFAFTDGVYCHYALISQPTQWGQWGLLETMHQPFAASPKMRVFQDILSGAFPVGPASLDDPQPEQ